MNDSLNIEEFILGIERKREKEETQTRTQKCKYQHTKETNRRNGMRFR
jgi:hypothetical protein